ncbi:MAG: winged helix-turn-helix transcriptional regulator [Spirochaetaceae bacterium]|nr:winged helix-turn-helix transcriptional regulator [Spirochaetaceae bacterium]
MGQELNCELIQSIFQFKKMIHKGFNRESQNNKINMTELIIMNEIVNNTTDPKDNVKISDLKGYLSISKGAISQNLSSLEKKAYIKRSINENNRRNIIVTLTPEGRKIMKEHYSQFTDKLTKIVSRLGEDNVKQMIKLVDKMTEISNEINNE